MAEVSRMRVLSGTRVGFWKERPGGYFEGSPFQCKGVYVGPDLGDCLPGQVLEQKLMEGVLKFSVGVLFRPDRGKRQKLETVLILRNWIPEMFEYEHWEAEEG